MAVLVGGDTVLFRLQLTALLCSQVFNAPRKWSFISLFGMSDECMHSSISTAVHSWFV